jgi:FdhD protein
MSEDESAPSSIARVSAQSTQSLEKVLDSVVVEEPLEIRVKRGARESQLGITMRTPGADIELAAGFLLSEGVISFPSQLLSVKICGDRSLTARQRSNIVIAEISEEAPDVQRELQRRFTISSACGICGSSSMSDLHDRGILPVLGTSRSLKELSKFPEYFQGRQHIFDRTGGLHAALLVESQGDVRWSREDVGRHNAVDKVIGAALMSSKIPLDDWTLVVSGRVGFEIVQKAIVAGISALVAVSAPTSLAIDLAREFNLTLVAFARNGKAMKYSPLLG